VGDLSELNRELVADVRALCRHLLPLGRERQGEWQEASTARGGLGDSLTVRVSGARAGVWAHFSRGEGGDLLDLIAYLQTNGNIGEAVRWARQWLGHAEAAPVDQAELDRRRAEARARAERAAKIDAERRARMSDFAKRMWLAGAPLSPGDVADRYLSSREVGQAVLGRRPNSLRLLGDVRHESGSRWPAMLACILGLDGAWLGVHRTFLHPEGRKAPVTPAKAVLGSVIGGHIPIWKGAHRQTLAEIPEGVPVYLCEGIEDALTVARLLPEARVLATVSLGNMARIALPPQVREVVLVADNDPETLPDGRAHPAFAGLQAAVAAHQAAGRKVGVARPVGGFKDFNAWLMEAARD
jgi:hypothetical protein